MDGPPPPMFLAGVGMWCLAQSVSALFKPSLPRPWYSFGTFMGKFQSKDAEEDPLFFEPSNFDWVAHIEENWEVVRTELVAYLRAHNNTLDPYFSEELITHEACWRVIGLRFWKIDNAATVPFFPKTMELFSRIPNLTALSFSQLQPGTAIKPHNGDSNAHMRCHLGIDIPGSLPEIGFQVGGEKRSWENGKVLMFCDAQRHTAFNNTGKRRFICIFDVIRPEYASQTNQICGRVLGALFARAFMERVYGGRIPYRTLLYVVYRLTSYLLLVPVTTGLFSGVVYHVLTS